MQQYFSFGLSALMALVGVILAVFGILAEEGKPAGVGFVLLCGAGIFATLFLGSRWGSRQVE